MAETVTTRARAPAALRIRQYADRDEAQTLADSRAAETSAIAAATARSNFCARMPFDSRPTSPNCPWCRPRPDLHLATPPLPRRPSATVESGLIDARNRETAVAAARRTTEWAMMADASPRSVDGVCALHAALELSRKNAHSEPLPSSRRCRPPNATAIRTRRHRAGLVAVRRPPTIARELPVRPEVPPPRRLRYCQLLVTVDRPRVAPRPARSRRKRKGHPTCRRYPPTTDQRPPFLTRPTLLLPPPPIYCCEECRFTCGIGGLQKPALETVTPNAVVVPIRCPPLAETSGIGETVARRRRRSTAASHAIMNR